MSGVTNIIMAVAPAFVAYYLTAVGHGVFEKSGVLNLAIDGVFTLGVAIAYTVALLAGTAYAGSVVALIIAAAFGAFIAFMVTKLPISHGAIGLSLMFVGYGLSALVAMPIRSTTGKVVSYPLSWMFDIGLLVFAIVLGVIMHYILASTKLGAAIRAAGENPHAASALGVNVLKTRIIAGLLGYALIGLGASFFFLAYSPAPYSEGMGMGNGWISFAISLAAGRHPLLTIASAAIFAGLLSNKFVLQGILGLSIHITNMIPYAAALAAMVIFMVTPLKRRLAPPRSLGKIYFKEERTV